MNIKKIQGFKLLDSMEVFAGEQVKVLSIYIS